MGRESASTTCYERPGVCHGTSLAMKNIFEKPVQWLPISNLQLIKVQSFQLSFFTPINTPLWIQGFSQVGIASLFSHLIIYFNWSATITQRQSHCLAHSSPGFCSQQVWTWNFSLGLELGEMMRQSLVSASKYTWVKFHILHSAFVVKTYVLLIVICLSGRILNLVAPLELPNKSRLMPALCFFYLTFITHILHHNTILNIYTLILDILT